jgi:putative membrane protein
MILPGISGSFILVIPGMYGPVLSAVTDRDLATLLVFALGAVVGLALFSQVLAWALSNSYDSVMAILIGLMAGSLRVLWPWPDGLEGTGLGAPTESVWQAVTIAVLAFLAVVGVSLVAKRLEHRTDREEADELGRWA